MDDARVMNGSTSGAGALRVLCLEDSPDDAELVREMLAGAGFQVEMDLSPDRPGFEELLAGGPYDVILADHTLPGFDAHGALGLAKVACPTTPFICVSGTIGEEATVELLKEGADDCVLKDRLSRLPFAVQRAIDESAREGALRQAEDKFATAFRAVPDSLTITRLSDGEFLDANDGYERMFGYTRAETVGKTTVGLSLYADPDTRQRLVTLLREMGEVTDFEPTLRRKDGTLFTGSCSARVLDIQGEECFVSVVRDITDRKRAEEALAASESRLKTIFDHAPSGIALIDALTGRICEANPAYARIAGRTIEEICELDWMSITHPDDLQADLDSTARLNAGETNGFQMKKRYLRPDGTAVWVDMTVAPVLVGGEAHPQHVCMTRDITTDKETEELAVRQGERIERTLTSVIDIAGAIGEMRDPYTAGHQRRVAELAARIAQELGMSDLEVANIRVAGLLHDIGKAAVPTELLGKPGLLSPIEFDLIKGHGEAGYEIAVSANLEEPIPELIYQHHERCDGSGYPRGLVGDQILSGAKVLAVADVVEAMMSHRPYRPALGIDAALAEIERGVGRFYDAEVSRVCVALFRGGHFEFSA